ncbi:hypothetical protein K8942_04795 [Candidatus Peribacteria bacterium]|nr:MAG: hypothetical protein K8942_04795 [Candidatus Peribacteria bacterium]
MNQEPVSDHELQALLERIAETPIPYATIQQQIRHLQHSMHILMWNPDIDRKSEANQIDTERGVIEVSEQISPPLTILALIAEQRRSYEESAAQNLSETYCLAAIDILLRAEPDLVQTLLPQAQAYMASTFDEKPTTSMDMMYRYADITGNTGPFEAVKEYLNGLMLTMGKRKDLDASLQKQ